MSLFSTVPDAPAAKIFFFYQDVKVGLVNRVGLKRFIQSIFRKEGKKLGSLNYVFCTDKALLAINREYLKHDDYTDIITFNLSEDEVIKGEIYISDDRVRENAQNLSISIKSERYRVMFHGVLHLCGYEDKTKAEKKLIRRKEDYYLSRYKL